MNRRRHHCGCGALCWFCGPELPEQTGICWPTRSLCARSFSLQPSTRNTKELCVCVFATVHPCRSECAFVCALPLSGIAMEITEEVLQRSDFFSAYFSARSTAERDRRRRRAPTLNQQTRP